MTTDQLPPEARFVARFIVLGLGAAFVAGVGGFWAIWPPLALIWAALFLIALVLALVWMARQ